MDELRPSPDLAAYLDGLVARYEQPDFIPLDPVSVPHAFEDPRDQEVIGLFAALLAWGRRSTMLTKLEDLSQRMRHRPYRFVREYRPDRDGGRLDGFGHRTFRPEDAVSLVTALQQVLIQYGSLERCFASFLPVNATSVEPALEGFSTEILSIVPDTPARLRKHLARPSIGSACKRLNMYLRWMVRTGPVDLGNWQAVPARLLVLPLDVHSGRVARALGLLTRRSDDWQSALDLTRFCRQLCQDDPARYDFAFFGPGAMGEPVAARFLSAVSSGT